MRYDIHFQEFLLAAAFILMAVGAYSQGTPRLSNQYYMQTRLMEDFTGSRLNRTIWKVITGVKKDNLYLFTDTLATVRQRDDALELSMHRMENSSVRAWSPEGDTLLTADYLAGEVMTTEDFAYGVFECSATFANDRGSFPAFWLYNDTLCSESARPEIDIVELKADRLNPTLDNNIWYYPVNCGPATSHEFTEHAFSWEGTHTFKGVWTPEKIEFWVDNTLLKQVNNTGQHWFPRLKQHVVLSQQIVRYGLLFPDTSRIEVPQTTRFHWVRIREFFLAPEIICPENIRNTVIATLDVDQAAADITWELTPERLFSGKTYGKGINASITPSSSFHGKGRIIYRFKMPSGENFYAEKEITLNGLY